MTQNSRREFLKQASAVAACGTLGTHAALAQAGTRVLTRGTTPSQQPVPLTWLGGQLPLTAAGITWGVPWARGVLPRTQAVTVTAAGRAIPTQSWPLAFWPDGSVKWTGLSIAADALTASPLQVVLGATPAPATPIRVRETAQAIEISTGPLLCRITRTGGNLIDSLAVNGVEVASAGRLIVLREDRSQAGSGTTREERFASRITRVAVEQAGPIRAVVRIEGIHANAATPNTQAREWLPFTVRLAFTAGLTSIRMVHSFVFDGDQATDFIRGIGVAFTVPFREERQNRHVRLAGDGDGIFAEPVLMSPGYRPSAVQNAIALEQAQLLGQRIPNLAQMPARDQHSFAALASWDSYKLTQLGPDSFSVDKRTNADSSWLHATSGQRARGFAFLGDVSGGLAVGMKRFWQKYPAALEISGAASPAGTLTAWLWSPDAAAMDLRHYDTVGHDINVTYEDYQPGFSTPTGVANTSELTLWPTAAVPAPAELAAMSHTANEPPLLHCAPQHYYDTHTLGIWSLPERTNADFASAEDQLDRAVLFFEGEVERRRWYGFWDYGDFIRTYDPIRHSWMYDIGGHGWNNTELMPNAWLWFAFLRSGRADIFRMAEAMHRNTTEVDVYHLGRFAGLGSRHNVNHWGDGAKEARINEAFIKRFYFYLTADERTGDLMREPLTTVEQTLVNTPPLREVLHRTVPPVIIRIGPDWLALASNWMAEWERTGDTRFRDYILTGMQDIGAMPEAFTTRGAFQYDPATKHLTDIGPPNMGPPDFTVLFGGDQIAMELIQLIDCPPFARAWAMLMDKWARLPGGSRYTHMRVTAYAANFAHDAALEATAMQLFRQSLRYKGADQFPAQLNAFKGPTVIEPVEETPGSSSFTEAMNTPEASQWAISTITAMELFRQFRPA